MIHIWVNILFKLSSQTLCTWNIFDFMFYKVTIESFMYSSIKFMFKFFDEYNMLTLTQFIVFSSIFYVFYQIYFKYSILKFGVHMKLCNIKHKCVFFKLESEKVISISIQCICIFLNCHYHLSSLSSFCLKFKNSQNS